MNPCVVETDTPLDHVKALLRTYEDGGAWQRHASRCCSDRDAHRPWIEPPRTFEVQRLLMTSAAYRAVLAQRVGDLCASQ